MAVFDFFKTGYESKLVPGKMLSAPEQTESAQFPRRGNELMKEVPRGPSLPPQRELDRGEAKGKAGSVKRRGAGGCGALLPQEKLMLPDLKRKFTLESFTMLKSLGVVAGAAGLYIIRTQPRSMQTPPRCNRST